MAPLWFIVGITFVLVTIGLFVILHYTKEARANAEYERTYKVKLRELENRKAKAINSRDDFEAHLADQDAIKLRERYIAKQEL